MKYIKAMLDHHKKDDIELKTFAAKHAAQIENFLKKWERFSKENWYQKDLENLMKVKAYI